DRAAGLDHELGHAKAAPRAARVERMTHRLHEMAWGGRVVLTRVRDPKAPTGAELARLELQLITQLDQEVEHDLHRLLVGAQAKDLRPEMRMQSGHLEPRVSQCLGDRLHGGAR